LSQELITGILIAVFAVSAIGLLLIGLWLVRNRQSTKKQGRISRFVTQEDEVAVSRQTRRASVPLPSVEDISNFREWLNNLFANLSSEKLQIKISSAYWQITDVEFIIIRVVATILTFALSWLIFGSVLAGLFIGAIAIILPPILLDRAIIGRQHKFQDQLLDVLVLIKGAVQSGYSLMQALDLAVNEVPAPASEEFGRVLHEVRLGISMEDALLNLSERMESDDLQIVITAVIINTQVGGNLSTVLETTIDTIRDRLQLFAEIRSLTSYSRWVGNFLSLLPFIAGLIIFMLSPSYFDNVKTSIITQGLFLGALVLVILGNIWIRMLVKIKV
jgi:tight adherence protein B